VNANDLPVIDLAGTPIERGRTHGESLRASIREAVDRREHEIGEATGLQVAGYLRGFLEDTDFRPAIDQWTPGLFDEVRGIAEGAAVELDRVFSYQLIDEEWLYRHDRNPAATQGAGDRCSCIGIFDQPGSPTLVAQNLDIEHWRNGYQVVLRVESRGAAAPQLIFSFAGMIALAGLNGRGVGVCLNALMGAPHRPTGLPVAFLLRGMLERTTLEDAVRFLRSIPHASGQNYMLGGPERVHSIECTSRSVHEYVWKPGFSRVCHTNHLLVEKHGGDQSGEGEVETPLEDRARANTEGRLRALERRLANADAPYTLKDVQATLSSHDDPDTPLCRHQAGPDGSGIIGVTAGSLIYELSDDPVFHLAPGPPCETEYRRFGF
jgi:isopenicillin-N N-acyltransferase-like protein